MKVTDEMVTRFLAWRLPSDFNPDGYISFDAKRAAEVRLVHFGTHLLNAHQARAMLEHVLAGATGLDNAEQSA